MPTQHKIGVALSGCGVMDGSEIHEFVLTLLAISKSGAEALCMAPNIEQVHVINHLTNNRKLIQMCQAQITAGR